MNGLFSGAAARAAMRSAHASLDELTKSVGATGFEAAAEIPRMLAADQRRPVRSRDPRRRLHDAHRRRGTGAGRRPGHAGPYLAGPVGTDAARAAAERRVRSERVRPERA